MAVATRYWPLDMYRSNPCPNTNHNNPYFRHDPLAVLNVVSARSIDTLGRAQATLSIHDCI
jgi:hypothetical protein